MGTRSDSSLKSAAALGTSSASNRGVCLNNPMLLRDSACWETACLGAWQVLWAEMWEVPLGVALPPVTATELKPRAMPAPNVTCDARRQERKKAEGRCRPLPYHLATAPRG